VDPDKVAKLSRGRATRSCPTFKHASVGLAARASSCPLGSTASAFNRQRIQQTANSTATSARPGRSRQNVVMRAFISVFCLNARRQRPTLPIEEADPYA
jgi:hypothetical protein